MDRFVIHGGIPLRGTIRASGAKNAALPCLAACLLTDQPVTLENIPGVRDIRTTCQLLESLGVGFNVPVHEGPAFRAGIGAGGRVVAQAAKLVSVEAPWEMVRTMRASTLILGPLVARFGEARVSMPGGCAIGARPIDLHLKGLEKLGAEITTEHGVVVARAKRLQGARIYFDRITVTGTEDLMMAAALAEGETVLENAAREPEVEDLATLLVRMGAKIEGAGTSIIRIQGAERLHGATHAIIPDRIETGTFLAAAGITGGDLTVEACRPDHLLAVLEKFRETGLRVETPSATSIRVIANGTGVLRAADMRTEEYPGFPTDMQAQYMALATQAKGATLITETIFENRFMHGPELVLAGLAASGETIVERVYHIDRGYERIEEKLQSVGAQIERASTPA